ncbi:MAG TPA: porin family protein [Burkholderiales bacterium]|nr:porin family protein [Burkholderiales bacterium]
MQVRAVVAAVCLSSLSAAAFAQSSQGVRMPYERGFWGHAGLSFGRSELRASCPGTGGCDDQDQTFRLFGGGRFNNTFGGEVGVMNFGKFDRGGGRTDGWGLDFAVTAGVPIGKNSSIFGKAGVLYARTEVDGTAAGLQTGKERGWGPRFGIGGQIGLTENWAVRADLDRFRLPLRGGKEDLDTLTLGAQYTFR